MNQNLEREKPTVAPYKASGNLNTAINNPSININDTMNINIQNAGSNDTNSNITDNTNNVNQPIGVGQYNTGEIQNNTVNNIPQNINLGNNINTNQSTVVTSENTNVEKQYVAVDNNKKKKTISFEIGPKFKIVLLIIVILLIFILLLPVISNTFRGY